MYNLISCLASLCSIIISICLGLSRAQVEDASQPKVQIPQGTLQGTTFTTRYGRSVSGFLGIPYGQPPIGNLRFANPKGADGWNETRDASMDGNMCPQILNGEVVGEEDCLYLYVYTPQSPNSTNSSLLPVMVYIHGGSFTTGSASSIRFGPEYLLDQDVVLVAPNYRIGPLGFLSTGDEVASGNWGLKDQVLALEWVQKNVEYFGGDPGQVTLFGQSAGGASVHLLTLSQLTNGLFHRYITQSGSALSKWGHQPRAAYSRRAFELGDFVGCTNETTESLINCLRKVNYTDILDTYKQFYVWRTYPEINWFPTDEPEIDGAFLTDSPTNLFTIEGIRDLPWISGVVRDEGVMISASFYEDEEMFDDLLKNMDLVLPAILSLTHQSDSGAAWTKALKSYYFNDDLTADRRLLLANFTLLIGDALFAYPCYNAVQRQLALAESPEYLYTFNYRGTYSVSYIFSGGSTKDYGVVHGDDNIYIFDPKARFAGYDANASAADSQVVDTMVQLWTSFAINGIPQTSALDSNTTWEPFSTEANYLRIGNDSDNSLEIQYSLLEERMRFWAELYAGSGSVSVHPKLFVMLLLLCLKFIAFNSQTDIL